MSSFKLFLSVALLSVLIGTSMAQIRVGPSSPYEFQMGGNLSGLSSNAVDLFTGKVSFSIPIAQTQGKGSSGINFGITYSSSSTSDDESRRDNAIAPTGVLGVGWSFQTARIINDYKGTATTEDDEYYLNLDGSSKKLLITGFNPSNKSYSLITQEYTPYKISYFKEEMIEKWEVLSDDGTVLSFGGVTGLKPDGYNKAGKSNSIEWLVSTGDKIMPTNTVFDGTSRIQSQLAVSWSLESVTDQFGNKTTYTYETSEIPVGQLTGCHYTRFQNLIGIEDNRGNTLEIIYNDKTSDEVIDSHPWSSGNPVYFQDKSNPRFITIFQLKNKDNIILKTVDLTYGFLGTGEKKKRFLTWITEKNPMGEVQPDLVFKYFETAADFNYGKLNKVISPMGQETVFTYQQIQLSSTDLDSPIRYYPPNNGENIVASSNGSCLLTITPDRSNNQIRYQVSECLNGKWDLVSSGNVAGLIEMYRAHLKTQLVNWI